MRIKTLIAVVALAAGAIANPAPASAANPGGAANLATAMHDEAVAYADYSAWSNHAAGTRNRHLSTLLAVTANQEREEHFAELARAANLVGTNAENLATAIAGETGETETIYPAFSAQASADGDAVTAALFAELADDEATHAQSLDAAYRALKHGGIWTVPVPPDVDPVAITEGPALVSGRTLANVRTAMVGEAYASARYRLYSQAAYASGKSKIGNLFAGLATIELGEHYAALANQYGLVSSDRANLWSAITAESGAIMSYATWSADATAAGDTADSRLLANIMGDEVGHRVSFAALIDTA